jgi:hypothetical protein
MLGPLVLGPGWAGMPVQRHAERDPVDLDPLSGTSPPGRFQRIGGRRTSNGAGLETPEAAHAVAISPLPGQFDFMARAGVY